MTESEARLWITVQPKFCDSAQSMPVFLAHAKVVASVCANEGVGDRTSESTEALTATIERAQTWPSFDRTRIEAALRVITDLGHQRWLVRVVDGRVEVCLPPELRSAQIAEKERIRHQELIKRDEQLSQPPVRKFVEEMECNRLHGERFVSVFSLMRDGRELAATLRAARALPQLERLSVLKSVTDPYLQIVSEDARCEFTGLRLLDVWRYFRHTWSNQYMSVPGRKMMFLVRDRAVQNHPILGIGALGSPVVQIKERDEWLGWQSATFLDRARNQPSPEIGNWLRRIVDTAISEIYVDDLFEESIISVGDLRRPDSDTLEKLAEFGNLQRRLHHRYVRSVEHSGHSSKVPGRGTDGYWRDKARTHLFRSKRALTLSDMLRARIALDQHLSDQPTADEVAALLDSRKGAVAVARILRKAKADRVGIAMAEITVCGAVPPYNPLLGGKLVAMLAASPEIVQAYHDRYSSAESEIASSMSGKPINRRPDLVFLGTTSLYGVGSSQYNRVRIPAERLGGCPGDEIRYAELGRSEAYGTSHYSDWTVQALVALAQQTNGGQRVNSIFGEGVSPKFRKVREGLDALGFPSDKLLRHGRRRVVYGVALARNTREFLLGMEQEPDYYFTSWGPQATASVVQWWRERWLSSRIESDRVLDEVAVHTLVRPIRHGARVPLPGGAADQVTHADDLE
jgi:hypothetical protein